MFEIFTELISAAKYISTGSERDSDSRQLKRKQNACVAIESRKDGKSSCNS